MKADSKGYYKVQLLNEERRVWLRKAQVNTEVDQETWDRVERGELPNGDPAGPIIPPPAQNGNGERAARNGAAAAAAAAAGDDEEEEEEEETTAEAAAAYSAVTMGLVDDPNAPSGMSTGNVKRGRGRPRKYPLGDPRSQAKHKWPKPGDPVVSPPSPPAFSRLDDRPHSQSLSLSGRLWRRRRTRL